MSKFQTAKRLWQNDKLKILEPIFGKLQYKGLLNWMNDVMFLKCAFRLHMGYNLDLKNPKTFNEILQCLKLYGYKPEYDKLVDKYEVKKYIFEKIGSEYVVPTYGIGDSVEDIDWNSLPNQFVIKTTHGSGGQHVFICRNKSTFDIEDNKVHSFDGEPEFLLICCDRYTDNGLTEDFFSEKWEHLDVKRPSHPNASIEISRPKELDEILELAERLSKGIPFVRSNFYVADSNVYFGELTFYPASGFVPFVPDKWDEKWGGLLTLPIVNGGGI